MTRPSFAIGIAGGTGAGKTTVVRRVTVEPTDVIIVDGILAPYDDLNDMFDLHIYVETDADIIIPGGANTVAATPLEEKIAAETGAIPDWVARDADHALDAENLDEP